MTEAEATAARSAADRRDRGHAGGNRISNWILVRERLARANAEATARITARQRVDLQRAKVALVLGRLMLEPGDAVGAGSTAPQAANLFRQSIHWALLSLLPDGRQLGPAEAWAASAPATLATVSARESERALVERSMQSTFVDFEEAPAKDQRQTARLLRRAAKRLLATARRPLRRVAWLKLVRLTRVLGVLLVCGAPLLFGVRLATRKPDLAHGKPWQTSSAAYECHPKKSECGAVSTDILFHTRQESNPWFEYDFGSPISFSSLAVRNRTDVAPEKAIPLIAEVSDDHEHFREIARQDAPFWVWKPSFPTQRARYLRLRVPRETMLHLEAIQVYR